MQWREQELLDILRNETLKTGDLVDRVNMSKTTALCSEDWNIAQDADGGRDVTCMMPQRFGCTGCRMRSDMALNWSVFCIPTGSVYGQTLKEVKDRFF